MDKLIRELIEDGVLQSPEIKEALDSIDRADFVPKEIRPHAYDNEALPIGYDQTISQPLVVVFMLELLEVREGNVVVDIGYGSGWQTALLSSLVGPEGEIYAFELIPELCKFGKKNVKKYPELARRVSFFCKNATIGIKEIVKENPKFDRIIAAADIDFVPELWGERLAIGGTMAYPSGGVIIKKVKMGDNNFATEEYPGFAFVPYIS